MRVVPGGIESHKIMKWWVRCCARWCYHVREIRLLPVLMWEGGGGAGEAVGVSAVTGALPGPGRWWKAVCARTGNLLDLVVAASVAPAVHTLYFGVVLCSSEGRGSSHWLRGGEAVVVAVAASVYVHRSAPVAVVVAYAALLPHAFVTAIQSAYNAASSNVPAVTSG